jgi:hypothetical protein
MGDVDAAVAIQPAEAKSPVLHFYMDETGPFNPDKKPPLAAHGHDWFGLGGILINAEDEPLAKTCIADLLAEWPQIRHPLHITDMRAEKKGFSWLGLLHDDDRTRFWVGYKTFLTRLPVAGMACVIDRPGYRARGYVERHGEARWMLCRTAFDIAVERSAKIAALRGRRLRIFFERSNPDADRRLRSYFKNLKENGLAFDAGNSAKYDPLSANDFQRTLISIEGKDKPNRMMQIADSYIYAIARGGYERKFDIYRRILERGKLISSQVDGALAATVGVKYSCFELEQAKRKNN